MNSIICYDWEGNAHSVAVEHVQFRPAVYGIFIENDQVLLVRHPHTDRWQPPGGILRSDETPSQAVRHYFRQITGMTPRLGPLLSIDDQYLIDENEQAWHLSVLYYALDRPEATVATLTEIESSAQPEWVHLAQLRREDLQLGYDAIEAARLRLSL